MVKKLKEFKVSDHDFSDRMDYAPKKTPVTPSNIDNIEEMLSRLIDEGDTDQFQELLQSDFIYPQRISSRHQFFSRPSGLDFYEYENIGYESYYVRPVIETLFYENPDRFRRLIALIRKEQDCDFYPPLLTCLNQIGISESNVLDWNYEEIYGQLQNMRDYGKKLADKNISKGQEAINLADDLQQDALAIYKIFPNKEDRTVRNLNILDAKLAFLHKLHSKDETFSHHRGLKRCINKLAEKVCTVDVLNGIWKLASGSWLFFNKTNTQKTVSNVHQSLGFDQREEITFSNTPEKTRC